jgi:uncharacterized membrane protein YidH (DUF202 family)
MKNTTLGFALILVGILMAIYTGINFITTERVVELGPINIDRHENHLLHWSPIVGALFFIAGVILIARDRRLKS